jgi:hypothetical protein
LWRFVVGFVEVCCVQLALRSEERRRVSESVMGGAFSLGIKIIVGTTHA